MASADLLGIDVTLRIDGHLRLLADVNTLFQRDPYPGGHRFFLGLQGPKAEKIFLDIPLGRFTPPTEEVARRALSSLGLFLVRLPRDGVEVLLNSIDDLVVERGRVQISGICSPILARGVTRRSA